METNRTTEQKILEQSKKNIVPLSFLIIAVLWAASVSFMFYRENSVTPAEYALFSMHYDGDSKTINWTKLADFENPTACTATAEKLREASTEYLNKMNLSLPNGIFPYACLAI